MTECRRIIEVIAYDPKWKQDFIEESNRIKSVLGEQFVAIHHIGSTSIPGIFAKPVIDILAEVKEISVINGYNSAFEELGYLAKGEFGIPGRRFFLKGPIDRTHHVHIFQTGSPHIARHLNFRDYMIAHPDDAKRYEKLKQELAAKFRYDIDGYCDGKDGFIKNMDKKAAEWKKMK